jgi:hypothetical protein
LPTTRMVRTSGVVAIACAIDEPFPGIALGRLKCVSSFVRKLEHDVADVGDE